MSDWAIRQKLYFSMRESFSSRVAQTGMKMSQEDRAVSFPSASNLFSMHSIAFFFSQISSGYELDSEKSAKCRQWWKRQLESVRETLYRQGCGEHKHSSESSNHSEVSVSPNYSQRLPVGFPTRGRQTCPVCVCNTSALKQNNETQISLAVPFS